MFGVRGSITDDDPDVDLVGFVGLAELDEVVLEAETGDVRGAEEGRELGQRPASDPAPEGRVPRIARLMALAIRFDRLIREGEVTDQADLARLGHVTRARVTQIMNLLHLAPDIQEELLFLPRTEHGRDPICEPMVRPIAAEPDWRKQRRMWKGS